MSPITKSVTSHFYSALIESCNDNMNTRACIFDVVSCLLFLPNLTSFLILDILLMLFVAECSELTSVHLILDWPKYWISKLPHWQRHYSACWNTAPTKWICLDFKQFSAVGWIVTLCFRRTDTTEDHSVEHWTTEDFLKHISLLYSYSEQIKYTITLNLGT